MKIPISFMFGLFVYLRQAGLSLHRSNLEALPSELVDYYRNNNIISPDRLVLFLQSLRNKKGEGYSFMPDSPKFLRNFSKKSVVLKDIEIDQIIQVLCNYTIFFKELETNGIEVLKNQIRLSLANLAQKLEKKLPTELINEGLKVEHLQQNECLQLLKFTDLLGSNWPFY